MRKSITNKFLSIILLVFIGQSCLASNILPEITGWSLTALKFQDLLSSKGKQGNLTEYMYTRESDNRSVKALILTGTAFGGQKNKPIEMQGDEGPIGNGSTYQIKKIGNLYGVIETVPYVGVALSMRISQDITVILEAPKNAIEDMESIALEIVKDL